MATRDTTGSGRTGAGSGPDIGEAFGAATRDYFEAMARALRGAASGATSGAVAPADPWRAVFDAWSAAAGGRNGFAESGFGQNPFGSNAFGASPFGSNPFASNPFGASPFGQGAFGNSPFAASGFSDSLDAVVGRFADQGRQWFGRMQALVERFGGDAAPADIAQAWKAMLGGEGANPFADLFAQMGGRGHVGFEQWFAQVAPLLRAGGADAWVREGAEWLSLPAFGPAREHQERGQALVRAMLALQQANDGYNALMLEAGRDAFVRFERKLGERSEPGRQLKSARALFDLWVDAAEEAYAEVALSLEFRQRYAALVNAQMRVRAGVQDVVERMTAQFGMPTRTEVDAAHRRIAQLERQLRRLQRGGGSTTASSAATATPPARRGAVAQSAAPAAVAETTEAKTTQMKASRAKSMQAQPAGKPVQFKSADVVESIGKRAAPRNPAGNAPSQPQTPAKPGGSGKTASKRSASKQSASTPRPGKAAGAKRKTAAEAKTRPAAPRAQPLPSRRAALAVSSAMPQAPEPLSDGGNGKTARASRRRDASAAKSARTR